MNRIILVITILLSIYYIYRQTKKQKKIIDKLNSRIVTLEKFKNSIELKEKNNTCNFINFLNL